MSDRTDPARRLVNIADLSLSLTSATVALELALAGVDALDSQEALPMRHAEGLQYLAQHVSELAEGVAALANDRPPRWRIHHVLDTVPRYEVPK
jgi:hypothetical protein